ncbi:MAG: hypothetical protein IH786_05245 [Proteobacteria bacterium]|nr:hypothetical protein [Pseudomonadota bacterium]
MTALARMGRRLDPAQELTNSLGETYFASGFNWYVKINQNLEAAGAARRVLAPTLVRPVVPILDAALTRLFVTGAVGKTQVRLTAGSPNLAFFHFVAARITTQGRSAIAAGLKFQRILVPDGARRITFQAQIEATFGTIDLLLRMHVLVRSQDSEGQRSPADTLFTDALP